MPSGKFVVNVEGAIYKGDKWLMIVRSTKEEHAGGTLAMVGGTVDFSDTSDNVLECALRRELMEEVGVTVGNTLKYVESKSFVTQNGTTVIDIVFLGEYASGEPTVIDPDEVESVQWMTLKEIETHPKTPPWILQSIRLTERMLKTQKIN